MLHKIDIEDDDVAWIVMQTIAKQAKEFDNMIDANGYGNLSVSEEDVTQWQRMSDKLWDVVRQFGVEKTQDEPLKIVLG